MLLHDLTNKFKDMPFCSPVEETNNFNVKDKVHTVNRAEKLPIFISAQENQSIERVISILRYNNRYEVSLPPLSLLPPQLPQPRG